MLVIYKDYTEMHSQQNIKLWALMYNLIFLASQLLNCKHRSVVLSFLIPTSSYPKYIQNKTNGLSSPDILITCLCGDH